MENIPPSVLIHVYAGEDDAEPMFEELPARQIDEDIYELLASPGLALNLARGDIVSIKNRNAHAEVLSRGGNFCVQIYEDEDIPQAILSRLEKEVAAELGGTLDGINGGNLSLTIPSKNGMDRIRDVFDTFRDQTGIQWYYANIYRNLDDPDDETLLDWWLKD